MNRTPNLAQKRYRLRQLTGEKAHVDAAPVRLHIATLYGAGWSARAIAGAADTSPSVVTRIGKGQQDQLRPDTARRLLAVDPTAVPVKASKQTTEPFVSRVGTVRRLQALLYMGWGHKQMREHCGLNTACLLHQQGRWVTRSTHDRVAAMFVDLWGKPGPSSKARTYARLRGYVGPLDWNDIDNDAAPVAADEEPRRVRHRAADLIEDYEWLTANGVSSEQAVIRLGVGPDAIDKARSRLGGAA